MRAKGLIQEKDQWNLLIKKIQIQKEENLKFL